jgi:hypothetical protein
MAYTTQSPLFPQTVRPPLFLDIGKVQIVFGCGGSSYTGTHDNSIATGGQTSLIFNDDAQPCFSNGDPDNQTALDDLTDQFANDLLDWMDLQFDYQFAGTINVQPNGYIDEIEFDYNSDIASTRMRTAPWNGQPIELGHSDPSCPAAIGQIMLGLTTDTVSARSGTTFGKGHATVYDVTSPSGATAGATIPIKNWFSSSIPSGKYVILIKIGCLVFVVSADC